MVYVACCRRFDRVLCRVGGSEKVEATHGFDGVRTCTMMRR